MKRILGLPTRLVFAAITVTTLIGIVAGAQVLFTHTFTGPAPSSQVLTSACAPGLGSTGSLIASTTPLRGSSGAMQLACPSGAAFSASSGTVTPSFTFTGNATGVGITLHSATCTSGVTALSDNTQVIFGTNPVAGTYDYCLFYTFYTGPASLTISWSQ